MSQTTAAMNMIDAKLEVNINELGWFDISGDANKVDPGDSGPRDAGDFWTFEGDKGVTQPGKRGTTDINILIAYTQHLGSAYRRLREAYLYRTLLQVRWSKNGQSGDLRWLADPGFVTKFPAPMGEASSADITAIEFTIHTPGIESETIP